MTHKLLNTKIENFSTLMHNDTTYQLVNGKHKTVLFFYPKDSTPGCTKEAIEFSELIEDFKDLNTKVIGVSKDSCKSHCKFIDKHNLKVDLISDANLDLMQYFDAWTEKKHVWQKIYGNTALNFYNR